MQQINTISSAPKQRNLSFDVFRVFASICIVGMHMEFSHATLLWLLPTMRLAVPFFFMTAGYYSWKADEQACVRSMKHLLCYLLIGMLFAILDHIVHMLQTGQDLAYYVQYILNLDRLRNLLFLSDTLYARAAYPLWFLPALLYCHLLLYLYLRFLKQEKNNQSWYVLIPILLLFWICLSNIIRIDVIKIPKWLFIGLPFFMAGRYLHSHSVFLRQRLKTRSLIIGFIGGLLLSYFESPTGDTITVGNIAATFCIVTLCSFFPSPRFFPRVIKALAWMGSNLSLWVYILHCIIYTNINERIGATVGKPVIAILTLLGSFAFALLLHGCKVGWHIFTKRQS